MSELSKRLKELRENSNLSQKELSQKLELSQSAIGMYETGKREPNTEILNKIVDFYGVTTDYLLGREEEQELPPNIMKIANDLKKLPEGEVKDNMLSIIRNMISMIDRELEKEKGNYK